MDCVDDPPLLEPPSAPAPPQSSPSSPSPSSYIPLDVQLQNQQRNLRPPPPQAPPFTQPEPQPAPYYVPQQVQPQQVQPQPAPYYVPQQVQPQQVQPQQVPPQQAPYQVPQHVPQQAPYHVPQQVPQQAYQPPSQQAPYQVPHQVQQPASFQPQFQANPFQNVMNQYLAWDKEQQAAAKNANRGVPAGERVIYSRQSTFAPQAQVQLAAVHDPVDIQSHIDAITNKYPAVCFEPKSIKARKAALLRLDEQCAAALAKCMEDIRMWNQQKEEYLSLQEYDNQVKSFRAEKSKALKMLGKRSTRSTPSASPRSSARKKQKITNNKRRDSSSDEDDDVDDGDYLNEIDLC